MIDTPAFRAACIVNAAIARYKTTWGEMLSGDRSKGAVAARGQCAALLREWEGWDWMRIARYLGDRHHSTVHEAAERFWEREGFDGKFQEPGRTHEQSTPSHPIPKRYTRRRPPAKLRAIR